MDEGNINDLSCAAMSALLPVPLPHKILVAEDEAILRELDVTMLSQASYQVESAIDGQEAWERLQSNNYDLLITDNNMPRLTGLQLVRKLRSHRFTLPIIMASGTLPADTHGLELTALLQKPFSVQQLVETVRWVFDHPGVMSGSFAPISS